MNPRKRRASAGFFDQIGVSTPSTSSRSIWFTRRSPRAGNAYRCSAAVLLSAVLVVQVVEADPLARGPECRHLHDAR